MMSPGNQGVFQLLKEVTFRRILAFCSWLEGCFLCASGWLVGPVQQIWAREKGVDHRIFSAVTMLLLL